jgi:hypothetical protein
MVPSSGADTTSIGGEAMHIANSRLAVLFIGVLDW